MIVKTSANTDALEIFRGLFNDRTLPQKAPWEKNLVNRGGLLMTKENAKIWDERLKNQNHD